MSAKRCVDVRPRLSEHLEGELDPGLDAAVRAHLAECAACRARLELLRRTVGALREIPDLPAPAGILSGVRQRLRPEPWHRRLSGGRPWLLGVPVGALATILVIVGVALFQARFPELRKSAGEAPATRTPAPRPAVTATRLPSEPPSEPPAAPAAPAAPRGAPARAGGELAKGVPPVALRPPPLPPPPPVFAPPSAPAIGETGPPAHFVIPEPEAERAPTVRRRVARQPERAPAPAGEGFARVGGREAGTREVLLPEREESGGGPPRRDIAAQPRGADLPSRDSRLAIESARRPAAFEGSGGPTVGGGPPSRSVSGRRLAPPAEPLESLSLVLPPDGDFEEVRRLVLRGEGMILESRSLDPGASGVAQRYRSRGAAPGTARVWEMKVRIPPQAVPRLLQALERRPGVRILERPALAAATGAQGRVGLRITVLQ